jgi:hypothetical protein
MAENAPRRSEAGMKSVKRNTKNNECSVKHARTIDESCGCIGPGGSRCDRPPHSNILLHHCCGETWEKVW